MSDLIVVGGGLAGSEAAWQAAQQGLDVCLYEMRPTLSTGAHETGNLAELVCSNSLGSNLPDRASGLLKKELRRLGSLILECADNSALPAGSALAVDRDRFSRIVTERIQNHPYIKIIREEVTEIPPFLTVIATGPLTSPLFSRRISEFSSEEHLFFFDAIAPIVQYETINLDVVFRASRYDQRIDSGGDYLNCPFGKNEYYYFVENLLKAERTELRSFEKDIQNGIKAGHYFEGCLPIEVIAERGKDALAFGPMRPVGLTDPRTGKRPYAVVQLRQDNIAGSLYNLVGFQTNLKFLEQKRVLSLIPGLEHAEFVRYGQMHRNTFIASPKLLKPTLQHNHRDNLFFAGQLTGVEGYMGNVATGLLAGLNASRLHKKQDLMILPQTTMIGALCHYITHADLEDFQPMKANFGILPSLDDLTPKGRRGRANEYAKRAAIDLDNYLNQYE